MELRHLRYFRAVAESKGFREAARRPHVVQPALSQTVSDLERELGVRLLTRNSRSVRLTSEGEVFLKEANEILTHAAAPSFFLPGSSASTVGASLGFGSHCARWRQRLRSTSSAPDDWTSGSLDPSQRRTVPGFDPSAYTAIH
jgi:DNA-binding transcriptional LysR family regulator